MHIVELLNRWPTGVYYLATPYSKYPFGSNPEERSDLAAYAAALLTSRLQNNGLVVYSPIVHSHALCVADRTRKVPTLDPLSHGYWMPIDRTHVERSCGLIVARMPGWDESRGIAQEIDWYRNDFPEKPRFMLDPHDLYFATLK